MTNPHDASIRRNAARARIKAVNIRSAGVNEYRAADGYVRHKCFISYHAADVEYAASFVEEHEDIFIPRAIGVEEDDGSIIDSEDPDYIRDTIRTNYLGNSTVTIVLVGGCTWARKFIDWEIYASLRESKNSTRNGLLGVLLPYAASDARAPDRLKDNIPAVPGADAYGQFKIYPGEPTILRSWIQTAFDARQTKVHLISNSRPLAQRNRVC